MVLHLCAGAASSGIMATVVSGNVDEPTCELYAAHVGIFGSSERDLASDCTSDHVKSSCAAASVMSVDVLPVIPRAFWLCITGDMTLHHLCFRN